MIAKLKGIIDSVAENWLVLDVNGVGYQLYCSQRTLSSLPNPGSDLVLYVETIVREDFINLYGFAEVNERDWFRILLSVQGVGRRAAMAILSVLSPEELDQSIATQNKAVITRADGIGPKLATRIINELKDKIGSLPHLTTSNTFAGSQQSDAISALVNLGYRQIDAVEAINRANQECAGDANVETLIRIGLSRLSRKSA